MLHRNAHGMASLRPSRQVPMFSRGLSGLAINADRLMETLHQTCQWGAAHPYGK